MNKRHWQHYSSDYSLVVIKSVHFIPPFIIVLVKLYASAKIWSEKSILSSYMKEKQNPNNFIKIVGTKEDIFWLSITVTPH